MNAKLHSLTIVLLGTISEVFIVDEGSPEVDEVLVKHGLSWA